MQELWTLRESRKFNPRNIKNKRLCPSAYSDWLKHCGIFRRAKLVIRETRVREGAYFAKNTRRKKNGSPFAYKHANRGRQSEIFITRPSRYRVLSVPLRGSSPVFVPRALNSSMVITVHPFSFPFQSRVWDSPASSRIRYQILVFSCPPNPLPNSRSFREHCKWFLTPRFNFTPKIARILEFFASTWTVATFESTDKQIRWKKTRKPDRFFLIQRRFGGSRDRIPESRKMTAPLYPRVSLDELPPWMLADYGVTRSTGPSVRREGGDEGRQIYYLSHASRTRIYGPGADERNADATDWPGIN